MVTKKKKKTKAKTNYAKNVCSYLVAKASHNNHTELQRGQGNTI